jgi:imidazolonepropionase
MADYISRVTLMESVRHVLVNAGPIAHLSSGDVNEPLRGHSMTDRELLVHEAGKGLVLEEGIVALITDSESIESEFGGDSSSNLNFIDLGGNAVLPGFVDCHTHLLWAGDRSNEMRLRQSGMNYQEIAERGGGITKTVEKTRLATSADLMKEGARRVQSALEHGTTSMECKSGYGLSLESELSLLEVIRDLQTQVDIKLHPTWLGAHDFPKNIPRKSYFEELLTDQLPAIHEQGIAKWTDVFCEPGWYDLEQTEELVKASEKLGIASRLHVDEFKDGGGLALASQLGAVSGDHVGYSSDEARHAAEQNGTMQTFLPGTPYVLGKDLTLPLQRCVEEAWRFSLATDFNPNCRSLSIPFVGSLATHRMGLDPLAALVAVTRNPATTLHDSQDRSIPGSLREGGPADLIVINSTDVDGWCQTPGDNPVIQTFTSKPLL